MKHDKDGDFEQYLNQLVRLLQKMAKSFPEQENFATHLKADKKSDSNLNVFLFNFLPMLPMTPEELEEMENFFEGALEGELRREDMKYELNSADKEFLRRNGIRF